MSSLFDIGRSGLQSYRRALAVTGQNITNVNTDGYKRREANLKEVAAGQGDIYSVSRSSGLGVRVSEISRSFDEFLLNKARTASSKFETSNTHLVALQQLESLLVPGDSNVGQVLEIPFDRPRVRSYVLEHKHYYDFRACLLSFLTKQEHTKTSHIKDFESRQRAEEAPPAIKEEPQQELVEV